MILKRDLQIQCDNQKFFTPKHMVVLKCIETRKQQLKVKYKNEMGKKLHLKEWNLMVGKVSCVCSVSSMKYSYCKM